MRYPHGGMGQVEQLPPPINAYEEAGDYVLDVTLTANQNAPRQVVQIDGDSDFIMAALAGSQTGDYSVVIRHANGRPIQSAPALNTNIIGTAQEPSPLLAESLYPSASNILVDVVDLSGAGNVIQIIFKGIRRYRSGG